MTRARPARDRTATAQTPPSTDAHLLVASADESLLDIVDNLLNRGVVLHGDVVLGLADVDLVYLRLSVLLCSADRVLPSMFPRSARAADDPVADERDESDKPANDQVERG